MTRALNEQNNADELDAEKTAPQVPVIRKPSEPVFTEPAQVPANKMAAAIAGAARTKAAIAEKTKAMRDALEKSLEEAEIDPPRDELHATADALLDAASGGEETKVLAKQLHTMLVERQEIVNNVRRTMGIAIPEISTIGENVEDYIRGLIAANGAMREVIRTICANAGTVRINDIKPIQIGDGRTILQRRFVDVGDEEPGQDHIVDLKYLIPAALIVANRFPRLIQEHANISKVAATAQHALATTQEQVARDSKTHIETRQRLAVMELTAKTYRPALADSPPGFYLNTADGRWIARYEGKKACFVTRWVITKNPAKAYNFPHKEAAQEALARLQFARIHRIRLETREKLRVVSVRYEEHTE